MAGPSAGSRDSSPDHGQSLLPSPSARSPNPTPGGPSSSPTCAASAEMPPDEDTERYPLLSPQTEDEDAPGGPSPEHRGHGDDTAGQDDSQTTKSIWYMVLLTISIGGLQIAWSVELSNGSPYLLSLGLSKSLMALVWIAGPLTGTLVQPYVGMLSDNCRVPWGKRKPFMLGGAAATMASLMFLAWTREVVGGLLGLFGADPESSFVKVSVIVAAVVGVYVLDFAINTVQAAIRAFIVDCAPVHQQETANAMASRIIGVGNIVGYVAGYLNLPSIVGFLGDTQFKVLCAIASVALGLTVLLSSATVRERDPRLDGPPPRDQPGVLRFFARVFTSIRRLQPQIKTVCKAQFCAWIGFFPFLFYTSSYIGEIYVQPYLEENPNMSDQELDKLYEEATRVGTFALLVNAVVSLTTNVFLPFFIAPTYDSQRLVEGRLAAEGRWSWLERLRIPGFTLKRAWLYSLFLFAAAMGCAVLVGSVAGATVIIALVGITWAMALWAPFAIISAEISRQDATARARKQQASAAAGVRMARMGAVGQASAHSSPDDSDAEEDEVDQAGVILGIHNMAIAAPQMISTFGSSLIFRVWQKPRGTPGDRSIAVVLALGGVAALVSTWFVAKLSDSVASPEEALALAQAEAEEGGRQANGRPGTSASRRKTTGV